MKKYALTCYAFLAIVASGMAQSTIPNSEQPKLRMALSAAPVLSFFNTEGNGDMVVGDGTRFNISYGLHADFSLGANQNYYFSTGVFQTNTGGTLVHDYFVQDGSDFVLTERTIDFRINYVEIPLTLMLRTNEIGYIRYFGRVGVDLGFNFKSTYDSQDVILNNPSAETRNLEDESAADWVNLMRAGLHLELGFEFNLTGNTNALVGVEFNNGLNNVFDDSYKLPTGASREEGLDVNGETGLPFVERRVESSINYFAINVGVYF